jgi:DNA-binding NtrC family response regulator
MGKNVRRFSSQAMDLIFSHHWPGNVRELENVVERSMVLVKGAVITPEDLSADLKSQCEGDNGVRNKGNLDMIERDHVKSVLERCGWNKYRAAKMMGISRSTLYSKISKHGLKQAV